MGFGTGVLVVLFLSLQIFCCWRTLRFLRDQRCSIERRQGGEKGAKSSDHSTKWLDWVADVFPEAKGPSTGWSRDDAFDRLEGLIDRIQSYQCLQRLAVMAPLLGVLITALGLRHLRVPADAALSISTILGAVTPLFSGVIIGAVLAIVNQILLQIVQWYVEMLREVAQGWFDRAIWSPAIASPREAVQATVSALGELAESIRNSARNQRGNAVRLRKASRSVVRASLASERTFRQFGTGLAEFTTQIQSLQKAAESTRRLAESMAPSLRESEQALAGAVKGFREAVVDQFVPAARSHGLAAKSSADSSEKTLMILGTIDETTRKLREQGERLCVATVDLGISGESLKTSIVVGLVPAQEALETAARSLKRTAAALPVLFETTVSAFSTTADQLRSTLKEDLAPAAKHLRESITDDLVPMSARNRLVLEDVSKVSDGLKTQFDQIQAASKSLEQRYAVLAEAASKQAIASEEITESMRTRLIPAQESIGDSATQLAGSADKLARFLTDGLGPATTRLAELGQVIEPMQRAAGAISAIGDLGDELRNLSAIVDRLHQAVDSAKALSDLESILGQLNRSFSEAGDLRQTLSEMPAELCRRLSDMSMEVLRRQAGDLTGILGDIVKQQAWQPQTLIGNGEALR